MAELPRSSDIAESRSAHRGRFGIQFISTLPSCLANSTIPSFIYYLSLYFSFIPGFSGGQSEALMRTDRAVCGEI
jgi:hypothetical protein